MLPGPLNDHVTLDALLVKVCDPFNCTFAELGVTTMVGGGVGVGVGVLLLPPPHATRLITSKERATNVKILLIGLHPLGGMRFLLV